MCEGEFTANTGAGIDHSAAVIPRLSGIYYHLESSEIVGAAFNTRCSSEHSKRYTPIWEARKSSPPSQHVSTNAPANSILSPDGLNCMLMNFPNREELLFRSVFAFPNASKSGVVSITRFPSLSLDEEPPGLYGCREPGLYGSRVWPSFAPRIVTGGSRLISAMVASSVH